MADTAETLRLMRHAADLLDALDPGMNARTVVHYAGGTDDSKATIRRAQSETVAIAFASGILRMVAAAIGDEPKKPQPTRERGADGRFLPREAE